MSGLSEEPASGKLRFEKSSLSPGLNGASGTNNVFPSYSSYHLQFNIKCFAFRCSY